MGPQERIKKHCLLHVSGGCGEQGESRTVVLEEGNPERGKEDDSHTTASLSS